ncbi:transcription antitermination factor NusB [Solimonas terrae]|uniref:Transcription antitermination protein NusB n=1 Tax=Solimonas terrae TaxID=1396819 RepID=A0A6M2BL46_9GAMM|nr:transcription antitermination factor NusB [Solimonas terrae]NGY03482.1 transcription antitermination factor NusB [Solimonas terrae]
MSEARNVQGAGQAQSLPQSRRGLARRVTVQAVYQWLLNEGEPAALLKQFREQDEGLGRADPQYFEELLNGIVAHAPELTMAIAPHLDRPITQLDPVEHAILLLAAYELEHRRDVPWKVAVNESVNLAKMFGAEDGYKFVNGVLDKLAHAMRPQEMRGF